MTNAESVRSREVSLCAESVLTTAKVRTIKLSEVAWFIAFRCSKKLQSDFSRDEFSKLSSNDNMAEEDTKAPGKSHPEDPKDHDQPGTDVGFKSLRRWTRLLHLALQPLKRAQR